MFRVGRCVVLVTLALALLEGALRLAGRPTGRFTGIFATSTGLWPPGFEGEIRSGPVPYRVKVNSHGFRGPELRVGLDAADARVICIGDSLTDGFYVDDADTYPARLGAALAEHGLDVEVLGAARAGGSMPRFLRILRNVALPLAPDVVIVTFVHNDLGDMERDPGFVQSIEPHTSLPALFATRTAIGELALDALLSLRSPEYRAFPRAADAGDERYAVPGGDDYEENARTFLRRFAVTDAPLLEEELSPAVLERLEEWRASFDEFVEVCRAGGARPVLLYVPPYPLLYLEDVPLTLKHRLEALAAELDVPFVDPTEDLRAASADGPLHLAPLDFHPNPRGNEVLAEALARELLALGMLEGPGS